MKLPEEALRQWVADEIVFNGGGRDVRHGKGVFTRDELAVVAALLLNPDGSQDENNPSSYLAEIEEAIDAGVADRFQNNRLGGPAITAQYLSCFDSIYELQEHFFKNGWLEQLAEEPDP